MQGVIRRETEWPRFRRAQEALGIGAAQHIAQDVAGVPTRAIPERPKALRLAGLEPFELA